MADGFIVRKGGVTTEQALAPTITEVSTTETSITFTITNNDAETAIIRHRLDDITDESVIVELTTNATSANITVTTLAAGTEFTVFATANVTGKVKSNVTQLAISTNQIPAPTITLVSKTDTSITFTLKNNSVETRDVTFGLTTPPTTTTISLASNATSGNQTFSNLDDDTTFTIFAQAEGGLIGQLNVTTDVTITFTAASGGTSLEYNSGGKRFRSHTFTSNGNFVVSTAGNGDRNQVDYLIISGAGSGGSGLTNEGGSTRGAGAGGAGGYKTTITPTPNNVTADAKFTVSATTFGITIGAGGTAKSALPGSTSLPTQGNSGATSSAFNITPVAGGGGGFEISNALNGGSGGGGGDQGNDTNRGVGGTGTSGQGFSGGNGSPSLGGGGGGGGAGSIGSNGTNSELGLGTSGGAGLGGSGLANTLRNNTSETRAIGGTGGGRGSGQFFTDTATSGAANTGNGGNGSNGGRNGVGGNGGSGIVVIRYEIATV